MRKVLFLLLALTPLVATCQGEPETVSIRLIDNFESAMVQGTPVAVEPERTEWRFDGEGTIPAPEEEAEDGGDRFGWTVFNDISGLSVSGGMLVGSTVTLPVLLGHRPDELDENDLLYAIQVRIRVSEGAEVGNTFSGARELDDEAVENLLERLTDQARPQLLDSRTRPTFLDFCLVDFRIEVPEDLEHLFLTHGDPLFVCVESGFQRPDHFLEVVLPDGQEVPLLA